MKRIQRKGGWTEDEVGRLWNVLWRAKFAVGHEGQCSVLRLLRVPREGRGFRPRLVTLIAHCGPDDQGHPVITLMQPNEDLEFHDRKFKNITAGNR